MYRRVSRSNYKIWTNFTADLVYTYIISFQKTVCTTWLFSCKTINNLFTLLFNKMFFCVCNINRYMVWRSDYTAWGDDILFLLNLSNRRLCPEYTYIYGLTLLENMIGHFWCYSIPIHISAEGTKINHKWQQIIFILWHFMVSLVYLMYI